MSENERFWLVFAKTGSINSGTDQLPYTNSSGGFIKDEYYS
jgi:hypothetical protein